MQDITIPNDFHGLWLVSTSMITICPMLKQTALSTLKYALEYSVIPRGQWLIIMVLLLNGGGNGSSRLQNCHPFAKTIRALKSQSNCTFFRMERTKTHVPGLVRITLVWGWQSGLPMNGVNEITGKSYDPVDKFD